MPWGQAPIQVVLLCQRFGVPTVGGSVRLLDVKTSHSKALTLSNGAHRQRDHRVRILWNGMAAEVPKNNESDEPASPHFDLGKAISDRKANKVQRPIQELVDLLRTALDEDSLTLDLLSDYQDRSDEVRAADGEVADRVDEQLRATTIALGEALKPQYDKFAQIASGLKASLPDLSVPKSTFSAGISVPAVDFAEQIKASQPKFEVPPVEPLGDELIAATHDKWNRETEAYEATIDAADALAIALEQNNLTLEAVQLTNDRLDETNANLDGLRSPPWQFWLIVALAAVAAIAAVAALF